MLGQVIDFAKLNKKISFQWRIQAFYPNKAAANNCQCVAYIDARDVMALLDDACGPENWMSDYKEVKGRMYGGIALRCGDGWVWKWDCGVESETEGEKGEASDAFKRAAVKWGVGRFLYDMGLQKLSAKSENGRGFPVDAQGNRVWDLTKYINDMNKTPGQRLGPFANAPTMAEHEAAEAAKAAQPNIAPTLKPAYANAQATAPAKDFVPAPPDGPQIFGLVRNVFAKSGPKRDGGTYTRFSITMDNGEQLTTFSESFATVANKSLESGLQVTVTYKLNGKWKDITDLKLSDDAAGQALEDSFMRDVQEPAPRQSWQG